MKALEISLLTFCEVIHAVLFLLMSSVFSTEFSEMRKSCILLCLVSSMKVSAFAQSYVLQKKIKRSYSESVKTGFIYICPTIYSWPEREQWDSYFSQGYYCVKCKQACPGFELWLPCPFLMIVTIIPQMLSFFLSLLYMNVIPTNFIYHLLQRS